MGYIECPYGGRCRPGRFAGECDYCAIGDVQQTKAERKAAGMRVVVPIGDITISQREFNELVEVSRQNP